MKKFKTYDLAVNFYRQSQLLQLRGDARDQLHRAARSIVLNLAEGRGKRTKADQLRFFHIAMGSLRECQAVLELEQLENTSANAVLHELGGALYVLIKNAIKPPS